MFDSLGPRKYAVPLAFIILIACVMSLVFFPMVHMEPKNLSFAVLSLDEGAETPQGTMNAGETMVNAIVSGEVTQGEESPIVWTKVESQEELDAALENNEYYGALIIPSGFTAAQVAAKQAETQAAAAQAAALMAAQQDAASASADGATSSVAQGEGASADSAAASGAAVTAASDENAAEAPAIKMVADNAKSPLVANLMQSMVGSMFSGTDVSVEVEAIHTGDAQDQTASTNPMGNMMSQQLTIMPTVIMSIVCALFTTRIFKKTGDASARWAALGKQVAFAVALSLLVALAAFCIAALGGGVFHAVRRLGSVPVDGQPLRDARISRTVRHRGAAGCAGRLARVRLRHGMRHSALRASARLLARLGVSLGAAALHGRRDSRHPLHGCGRMECGKRPALDNGRGRRRVHSAGRAASREKSRSLAKRDAIKWPRACSGPSCVMRSFISDAIRRAYASSSRPVGKSATSDTVPPIASIYRRTDSMLITAMSPFSIFETRF